MFRVTAKPQKANLRKLNMTKEAIKKKKKGKLTVYVAKKSMLSMEFFTTNKCSLMCEEFKTLSLSKVVLRNVLTGLHKTRGDPIHDN